MPFELAVLDHEALRRVIDDDLDAFFLGVVQLPGRRFEVPARAARHHLDVLAAQTARRPAAIHRRVADADDQHLLADRIDVSEGDRLQPIDPDVDAIRVVAAGDVEILAARRAAADEDSVEALAEQLLHAVDRRVVADIDAHVENRRRSPRRSTLLGQAERGNVGAHQPARLVQLFENRDFVAERQQIVGDRERRRTGADAGDALAVFSARESRGSRSAISPCDPPPRASGGKSPPVCHPAVRGGRPARTAGRRCGRESPETRSIPGSACRRRCSGLARSAGCTPARWCAPDRPTGNRRLCESNSDRPCWCVSHCLPRGAPWTCPHCIHLILSMALRARKRRRSAIAIVEKGTDRSVPDGINSCDQRHALVDRVVCPFSTRS